jgi:transcription elongation factor GreB
MSRAFVRESDAGEPSDLLPLVSPLPPGVKDRLTPDGADQLRAELARLEDKERSLHGVPFDDIHARSQLRSIDQRIRSLRQCLGSAEIVPPPEEPTDVVGFGATVTVREGVKQTRYRIVGVHETDVESGRVSWLSPIGRALMKARVGQHVSLGVPSGEREFEVVRIEYER